MSQLLPDYQFIVRPGRVTESRSDARKFDNDDDVDELFEHDWLPFNSDSGYKGLNGVTGS